MSDSVQNKYQDNTVPVCDRDDQNATTRTTIATTTHNKPRKLAQTVTFLTSGGEWGGNPVGITYGTSAHPN